LVRIEYLSRVIAFLGKKVSVFKPDNIMELLERIAIFVGLVASAIGIFTFMIDEEQPEDITIRLDSVRDVLSIIKETQEKNNATLKDLKKAFSQVPGIQLALMDQNSNIQQEIDNIKKAVTNLAIAASQKEESKKPSAEDKARLLSLTARLSDLQLKLQFNNQARIRIANSVSKLTMQSTKLKKHSNIGSDKKLRALIDAIQQTDRILEMQARRIEAQIEAVGVEIEAVRKDSSIRLQGGGYIGSDKNGGDKVRRDKVEGNKIITPSPPNHSYLTTGPVVRIHDFRFELQSCKGFTDNVVCDLMITNIGPDRRLQWINWSHRASRAIDNYGEEYKVSQMTIGSQTKKGTVIADMERNSPRKSKIYFKSVNPSAQRFAQLKLFYNISERGSEDFSVSFENIPIN